MTRTLQISAIVLSLIFNINQSHAQSGAVVNYRDILLGAFPDTTRLSTWMAYVDENLEELVNGGIDQTARDSIAAHRSNIDALYGLIGPGADSVRAAHTADTVTAILPVAQIAGIDSGDFAKVSLLDTYAVDSARAAFKADTVTGDLSKEQVGLGNVNNTADINKIVAYADTSRVTHQADTVLNMLPQSQITGLTAALGGKADTSNFVKKNVDRVLFYSGLIDSVKTTDTVYIGDIYPAMMISKIKYHATRDVELTIKIEMVDSLTQTSGATLIDTTTCINSVTLQEADEDIDEVSLVEGKILRYVFAAIGTMPKHFAFSIIGRE